MQALKIQIHVSLWRCLPDGRLISKSFMAFVYMQGLLSIVRLLRASTAPLYRGSKIKMLEITYHGQNKDVPPRLLQLSPHDVEGVPSSNLLDRGLRYQF